METQLTVLLTLLKKNLSCQILTPGEPVLEQVLLFPFPCEQVLLFPFPCEQVLFPFPCEQVLLFPFPCEQVLFPYPCEQVLLFPFHLCNNKQLSNWNCGKRIHFFNVYNSLTYILATRLCFPIQHTATKFSRTFFYNCFFFNDAIFFKVIFVLELINRNKCLIYTFLFFTNLYFSFKLWNVTIDKESEKQCNTYTFVKYDRGYPGPYLVKYVKIKS